MKPRTDLNRPCSFCKQRGDLLIESLIGMVLMAIIGMGVVFVTSKMSISQKDMRMQEIAVNQLRALLINNGNGAINLCPPATPTVNLPGLQPINAVVQGCGLVISATVNNIAVANVPRPLIISVTHDALGGEIVVGGSGG
jgi:type II secretory pathway pseudopilin PulG